MTFLTRMVRVPRLRPLPPRGAALRWVGMIAFALVGPLPTLAGDSPTPEARAVVSAVVRNQRSTGTRARARLSIEAKEGPTRSLQVLIKGRREGATNETLVVVMWPREQKGQAWMIRRTDAGEISGFRFAPPNEVRPVSAADLDEPLFGSDLCVDDFAESFWEWPDQRITGEEKVGNLACWVVESRTTDPSIRHPRIRSWLAKERPVAMRVEKSDREGTLRKRLTAARVVRRDDDGWSVGEWTVETVEAGSRTTVSGSRSDRDLTLPASDFTVEGVRQLIDPD